MDDRAEIRDRLTETRVLLDKAATTPGGVGVETRLLNKAIEELAAAVELLNNPAIEIDV